jgi:hypothetical protein
LLLRIDYKSSKEVLQKDVQNIASKQIFARWQAILSIFHFDNEYIKGNTNFIPDFLTYKFLQNKSCCLPSLNIRAKPLGQHLQNHKKSKALQNLWLLLYLIQSSQ